VGGPVTRRDAINWSNALVARLAPYKDLIGLATNLLPSPTDVSAAVNNLAGEMASPVIEQVGMVTGAQVTEDPLSALHGRPPGGPRARRQRRLPPHRLRRDDVGRKSHRRPGQCPGSTRGGRPRLGRDSTLPRPRMGTPPPAAEPAVTPEPEYALPGLVEPRTLEALSQAIGEYDRVTISHGTSQLGIYETTTVNHSVQRQRVLSPGEIAQLPAGHGLLLNGASWALVLTTPLLLPSHLAVRPRRHRGRRGCRRGKGFAGTGIGRDDHAMTSIVPVTVVLASVASPAGQQQSVRSGWRVTPPR
jgi:hypothetical protein